MPRETVPHLDDAKLALRAELEDVLLAYESIIFVSVGFSSNTDTVLLTLGTDNMSLCKAQLITIVPYIEERMKGIGPVELHIVKGKIKG